MADDRFKTGGAFDALGEIEQGSDKIVGRELGEYRVLSLIAEGGMGRVYRAERTDGSFEREVAIKVSTVSSISTAVRERFAAEQSILAGLNHPNISQLYDASATEEGWPYIVMELVDGGPLDEYCVANDVDLDDRVRLIIEVVDAVAFAHARLVVHRDIKPSNVLVNPDGRPKLLDFGIAKLLDSDEQNLTRGGMMTPRYASPEQLLQQPITTASDIHQIGMLLYEVLTGESLNQGDSPSTAIQRAAEQKSVSLDAVACAKLPRDLLSIIRRCLQVSPEDRYSDANALRNDLLAYLSGYAVSAAPASWYQRLGKLVLRNRTAAATIAAAIVTVAASTIWYAVEVTKQRDEAEAQRELAEESLSFLSSFYRAASPDNAQGRTMTALDLLDDGAARIGSELVEQPEIQSRLYLAVSETYRQLSQFDRALEMVELGLDATNIGYPNDESATLSLRNVRASVFRQQGRPADAARIYRELIEIADAEFGPDNDETLRFRHNLALSLWQTGETDKAISEMRSLHATKAQRYGDGDRSTLLSANALVAYLRAIGALDESIAIGEKYQPIARSELGELHSLTLDFGTNLALALSNRDGPDAAIPLMETIAEANKTIHGGNSFEYWHRYAMLVKAHIDAGRREPWLDELREATNHMSDLRGHDNGSVLINKASIASVLVEQQRTDEAVALLDEVLAVQAETIGLNHPNAFYTQVVRAAAQLSGNQDNAAEEANALLARMIDVLGADHVLTKMLQEEIASSE